MLCVQLSPVFAVSPLFHTVLLLPMRPRAAARARASRSNPDLVGDPPLRHAWLTLSLGAEAELVVTCGLQTLSASYTAEIFCRSLRSSVEGGSGRRRRLWHVRVHRSSGVSVLADHAAPRLANATPTRWESSDPMPRRSFISRASRPGSNPETRSTNARYFAARPSSIRQLSDRGRLFRCLTAGHQSGIFGVNSNAAAETSICRRPARPASRFRPQYIR